MKINKYWGVTQRHKEDMSIQGSSPDEIGALRGFPLKITKVRAK
jgi:hypothetical protein